MQSIYVKLSDNKLLWQKKGYWVEMQVVLYQVDT